MPCSHTPVWKPSAFTSLDGKPSPPSRAVSTLKKSEKSEGNLPSLSVSPPPQSNVNQTKIYLRVIDYACLQFSRFIVYEGILGIAIIIEPSVRKMSFPLQQTLCKGDINKLIHRQWYARYGDSIAAHTQWTWRKFFYRFAQGSFASACLKIHRPSFCL